jgi:hypothetical protein
MPKFRLTAVAIVVALVSSLVAPRPAVAASQDDAGRRRDAGNTFEVATPVRPHGFYIGRLDPQAGDRHDYYRFFLREGSAMSVLVELGADPTDPVELLDPSGNPVDLGVKVASLGLATSAVFTGEFPQVMRLAVHRATTSGEYRLHIQSERFELEDYALCFLNCEGVVNAPTDLIFGGSLPTTGTKVLLVPPTHGDLGNPSGPTVVDYIDTTLRAIRKWNDAIKAFTADYPRYDYLRKIKIHIDIFDGVQPVDPALYDVIIGYAAAGPAFRGVASHLDIGLQELIADLGLEDSVRFTGRFIVLSLYGSSPRAGQVLYDFPEINDLEIVTMHEFGHTFGLGHTRTWHPKLGPDLMNSPAPFTYGDGFPAGDGGERTKMKCLSTINLYGMAVLYRWVPEGKWRPSSGQAKLPKGMPYKWYC